MIGLSTPRLFNRTIQGELVKVEAIFPKGNDYIPTKPTGSAGQKRGIRYENSVCEYLTKRFNFVNQITFEYIDSSGKTKKARPDGLIVDEKNDHYTLVEIKTYHSEDAYYQLEFYKKILLKWLPGCHFSVVEICELFTPGVKLPVSSFFITDPSSLDRASFGHNIWILSQRSLKLLAGGMESGVVMAK